MAKLAKKLPKRVGNVKAAAKRERSFQACTKRKLARQDAQRKRERANREILEGLNCVTLTQRRQALAAYKLVHGNYAFHP